MQSIPRHIVRELEITSQSDNKEVEQFLTQLALMLHNSELLKLPAENHALQSDTK